MNWGGGGHNSTPNRSLSFVKDRNPVQIYLSANEIGWLTWPTSLGLKSGQKYMDLNVQMTLRGFCLPLFLSLSSLLLSVSPLYFKVVILIWWPQANPYLHSVAADLEMLLFSSRFQQDPRT